MDYSIQNSELAISKMGAWSPAANYGVHIKLGEGKERRATALASLAMG